MQSQSQSQEQQQRQLQLLYRTLDGFLESLQELDNFEDLPKYLKEASSYDSSFLTALDNCITQLNAPVMQVNSKEIYNANKIKLASATIEWLSTRTRPIDIIDELCNIYFYNCLGEKRSVPERVQFWDGKVSQDELQEYAQVLIKAHDEVGRTTKRIENGEHLTFEYLDKAKDEGSVVKGIERIYKSDELLAHQLHKWLFDKELKITSYEESAIEEPTIFDKLDEMTIIKSFIMYEAYNAISQIHSKPALLKWFNGMKELSKPVN